MHRRLVAGLTVAIVLITAVAAGAVGVALTDTPASGGSVTQLEIAQTSPEGFDSTEFTIRVYENGSARWTVQYLRPLNNQSEIDDFREFADQFNSEPQPIVENFRTRSQYTVDNTSRLLDRPMEATNFQHDARIDELAGTVGKVELSFTWNGFAREGEDDTLIVDDIFGDGLVILENQRFIVENSDDLVFIDAEPEPDQMATANNLTGSDYISWQGEELFNNRRPFVRLVSANRAGEFRDGGGGDGGEDNQSSGSSMLLMALTLLLVVVGLGGGVAWYAGLFPSQSQSEGSTATTEATSASPETTPEPEIADEELLSDENRVVKLLEDNGGRMKQVDIVEETDWSKSKVSMLLSDMEEEGNISKLRVGRENIISLAGEEPDAAGSPFDDK